MFWILVFEHVLSLAILPELLVLFNRLFFLGSLAVWASFDFSHSPTKSVGANYQIFGLLEAHCRYGCF